jgi:glycosyltransferase involved in cell wall biosynthesis
MSLTLMHQPAADLPAPQISVVIPTRNRQDYLVDSVKVALAHCATAQVVVSDNSDTDALRAKLSEQIASGRLIYDHSAEMRSVIRRLGDGHRGR